MDALIGSLNLISLNLENCVFSLNEKEENNETNVTLSNELSFIENKKSDLLKILSKSHLNGTSINGKSFTATLQYRAVYQVLNQAVLDSYPEEIRVRYCFMLFFQTVRNDFLYILERAGIQGVGLPLQVIMATIAREQTNSQGVVEKEVKPEKKISSPKAAQRKKITPKSKK